VYAIFDTNATFVDIEVPPMPDRPTGVVRWRELRRGSANNPLLAFTHRRLPTDNLTKFRLRDHRFLGAGEHLIRMMENRGLQASAMLVNEFGQPPVVEWR